MRCQKQVVSNNSGQHTSKDNADMFTLGLNLSIAPTEFQLVEYITSAENLCQNLEKSNKQEDKTKAQTVRNIVTHHL